MRVEKTSSNEQISFANIPVKFSIHFNEEDDANIYPDGYGKEDNFGYQTSSLKADFASLSACR